MRVWKYEAQIIRVVDGDTIVCDIDQGMNHWSRNQYVRLAGINAPEKTGATKEAGLAAADYLNGLLPDPPAVVWLVTIAYKETEKYGRILARVYTEDPWTETVTVPSANQLMIDGGHAVQYMT